MVRFPNPRVRLPRWLPRWHWLDRLDRWRAERGILTGRWTQAEIDEIKRLAHQDWLELQKHIE